MENHITKIRKRDGSIALFNQNRVVNAVFNAAQSIGGHNKLIAKRIAQRVVEVLNERFDSSSIPSVEDIQDLVEKVLIEEGHAKTAKAFILYRQDRSKLRQEKKVVLDGLLDDSKLDLNQVRIVAAKYLRRDESGKIVETPSEMLKRVAKSLIINKEGADAKDKERKFYMIMRHLDFLPSGRILANAGLKSKQLPSCYVLPIPDSIKGIFESLALTALIHKAGAGTGFDFSLLRPKGSQVTLTTGVASGPVSFMELFDAATETIKKGSKRGANMAVLRVDHPDIVAFVTAKKDLTKLTNFNISVAVTNTFMHAVEHSHQYDLIDPSTKKAIAKADAGKVFDLICRQAWESGEPGILFLDKVNEKNPLPKLGEIAATDPCGELPLYPYESSVLGSINLAHMVENKLINWKKLKSTVHCAVEILDNAIDVSEYPNKKTEEASKQTRKIALGIMGYADMLYQLEIPYDSEKGIETARNVMSFIQKEGHKRSSELGKEKGSFKAYAASVYAEKNIPMRNSAVTSIGPTGTISMVAGTSYGCEPNFGLGFIKNVMNNQQFVYINKYFEQVARDRNFYSEELMRKVAENGTVRNMDEVPLDIQKTFVVAHETDPEYHIKTQAAFQESVDSAISKTINFSHHATLDDIRRGFVLAWKLGCKGVTIYRDGSRSNQVLNIKEVNKEIKKVETPEIVVD